MSPTLYPEVGDDDERKAPVAPLFLGVLLFVGVALSPLMPVWLAVSIAVATATLSVVLRYLLVKPRLAYLRFLKEHKNRSIPGKTKE